MAPHCSTLAWRIPRTKEPGGLQSMGSLWVRCDWATSLHFSLSCTEEGNGNPLQCSCLENPREPSGLPSMGSHRVGHDWSDLAAAAADIVYLNKHKIFIIKVLKIIGFRLILKLILYYLVVLLLNEMKSQQHIFIYISFIFFYNMQKAWNRKSESQDHFNFHFLKNLNLSWWTSLLFFILHGTEEKHLDFHMEPNSIKQNENLLKRKSFRDIFTCS